MSVKSIGQVATYKPLAQLDMEELAARQKTIVPSGGVEFARKGDGEDKQRARQMVLDLFTREQWPGYLNMLTMPGVRWRFERLLLASREPGWMQRPKPRRTHFTGVENDRSIYHAALTQIPGVETPRRVLWPVKREKFPFAELAIKSRFASYFRCEACHHIWVRHTSGGTQLATDACPLCNATGRHLEHKINAANSNEDQGKPGPRPSVGRRP